MSPYQIDSVLGPSASESHANYFNICHSSWIVCSVDQRPVAIRAGHGVQRRIDSAAGVTDSISAGRRPPRRLCRRAVSAAVGQCGARPVQPGHGESPPATAERPALLTNGSRQRAKAAAGADSQP